jgi:hypothetical protein
MLMIDGRLQRLREAAPAGTKAMDLLDDVFGATYGRVPRRRR